LQKQPGYQTGFSAISFFNGSSSSPGSQLGITSVETSMMNQFLADAVSAASTQGIGQGPGGLGDETEKDGAFGVYALNLYSGTYEGDNSSTDWIQPQLCEVPEPSTIIAGTLLIAPFGLSTFRVLRKNRAT
jgi:hypothetical protein